MVTFSYVPLSLEFTCSTVRRQLAMIDKLDSYFCLLDNNFCPYTVPHVYF